MEGRGEQLLYSKVSISLHWKWAPTTITYHIPVWKFYMQQNCPSCSLRPRTSSRWWQTRSRWVCAFSASITWHLSF